MTEPSAAMVQGQKQRLPPPHQEQAVAKRRLFRHPGRGRMTVNKINNPNTVTAMNTKFPIIAMTREDGVPADHSRTVAIPGHRQADTYQPFAWPVKAVIRLVTRSTRTWALAPEGPQSLSYPWQQLVAMRPFWSCPLHQ